jgi:peptidyl-tRNA hydrolase, PTH1 family
MLNWLWRLFAGPPDPLAGVDQDQARLIVGLGNPGPKYAHTRHNVGFQCLDVLASRLGLDWATDDASLVAVAADRIVLAKPQTFMNRSGQAVRDTLELLKLENEHALVVYDEMDLAFGVLRLRERGSPGTHNGMRSVVSSLGSENIPRLRVGIGQSSPGEATSHVLSEFSDEERDAVDELVKRAADAVLAWAEQGAMVAMNRYNKA